MSDLDDMLLTREFAARLCDVAVRAGEAILEVYARDDFDVRLKGDDSPLTEADLAANRIIVEALQRISDIPILSEESEQPPWPERREWTRLWLVDPLDGTREFVKRNDEFTVNIALVEEGEPVLSVVHAPALAQTFWAVRGIGAFERTADEETRPISVADAIDSPLVVVVSRSHLRDADRDFLEKLEERYGAIDTKPTGSSLKLCLVARGDADLYPRFGPTMEWDTAAAHCVVAQAGGMVETLQGEPLRYNKESLLNPFFIVRRPRIDPFWTESANDAQ